MGTILKVILCTDGNIHIVLENTQTVVCTPHALIDLLQDPCLFSENRYSFHDISSRYINPHHIEMDAVPGVTLLYATSENEIVCKFPLLFELLFSNVGDVINTPLYAQNLLAERTLADEKQLLLSAHLLLAQFRSPSLTLDRKLNLPEDEQASIFKEIINAHLNAIPVRKNEIQPDSVPAIEEKPLVLQFPESSTQWVSLREYADAHNETYQNILNWANAGKLVTAHRTEKNKWLIDINDTFISVSYKGQTLDDKEYPEDSVFFNTKFLPRYARQRGGAYSMSERTVNTICILTAADDFGHVVTRFVGIGAANTNLISQAFGNDRLLLTVPEKDPFAALNCRKKKATALQSGEPSLLISDGEIAIERFAKIYGIQHEWHVFRSDGVQRKLPEGYHDIQVVNNLHSRLKTFLKQTHHASSRYLPGFLILFDFIINTGATKEAIRELFCILAKQNGAKSDQFFEDLFSVPNYLLQWAKEDNPLSHLKFNEILGFFLHDQQLKGSNTPFRLGSMDAVAERCGLTREQLRINYKNFKATPIGDAILNYFATVAATGSPPGKRTGPKKEITAVDLAVYDELYKWRKENPYSTLYFDSVVPDLNARYNAKYTKGSLERIMAVIPEAGLREPIPQKVKYNDAKVFKPGQWKEIQMYEEYWALKAEYRRKGLKPPKRDDLCAELAEKHGLTKNRVISLITHIPAGYSKGKCNYAAPPQNTSA